ncbi:hypothetical protein ACRRTK_017304 [Alexandromys fortis]
MQLGTMNCLWLEAKWPTTQTTHHSVLQGDGKVRERGIRERQQQGTGQRERLGESGGERLGYRRGFTMMMRKGQMERNGSVRVVVGALECSAVYEVDLSFV